MAKQLLTSAIQWMRAHHGVIYVAVGVVAIGCYIFLFVVPRSITFAYVQPVSCIGWPTLLPAIHRSVPSDKFESSTAGEVRLFGLSVLATKLCVQATSQPKNGDSVVGIAPFGWMIFRQHIRISTPELPHFDANVLTAPVAATKPVIVALNGPDGVHTYTLHGNGKVASCKSVAAAGVECDLPALQLKQGKEYGVQIQRAFQKETAVTVVNTKLTTLTATTIVSGSVKSNETLYSRPTTFTFKTDKALNRAKVSLAQEGETHSIETMTEVKDKTITATLSNELPRDKKYTLTINEVEAVDGSALTDPYKVAFRTSSGPKVANVSIGKAGVGLGTVVAVTFDQDLSTKQNIAKFASIAGGTAQISVKGRQIFFALGGMGLCKPFTLSVAKGVASKYDIASTTAWSYSSRTVCHTTTVYGYSVGGNALVAYNFGTSGPLTLYVGAIHGNESSSRGLMNAWVDDLEANPSLYSNKRVVVVPAINPDGLAVGTRTNARGVNLNRNFPTDGWQKDIDDTDGYHKGGGGSAPLSEPEAKALANFTISLHPRLLLSFHAVGSLVTGDPGGYSAGYAARYASMVGYSNATGQSGTFDYDITGAYEDWSYSKQGIPSMVIELGSYGYYNFPHHQAALRAMLQ